MGARVERIGLDGWERVRAVRLRALRDAPDAFGMTLAQEQARTPASWRERLTDPAAATFLAVDGQADVGLIVGRAYEGEPGAAGLFAMWVAPARRGRGIAQGLVDAVVAWARAGGFRRVLLDVGDENAPAVRLYAQKGFVPTGVTGCVSPDRAHVREHQRALDLGG